MEHGAPTGLEELRSRQGRNYDLLHVRRLGALHLGHPGHDGGTVGIFAYIASALGRVYEQILLRPRLRVHPILVQNHPQRGRGVNRAAYETNSDVNSIIFYGNFNRKSTRILRFVILHHLCFHVISIGISQIIKRKSF